MNSHRFQKAHFGVLLRGVDQDGITLRKVAG
jgi:hypothetical protein